MLLKQCLVSRRKQTGLWSGLKTDNPLLVCIFLRTCFCCTSWSWLLFCTPVLRTEQLKHCKSRLSMCARSDRQICVWYYRFFLFLQHYEWTWEKKDSRVLSLSFFWVTVVTSFPATVSYLRAGSPGQFPSEWMQDIPANVQLVMLTLKYVLYLKWMAGRQVNFLKEISSVLDKKCRRWWDLARLRKWISFCISLFCNIHCSQLLFWV